MCYEISESFFSKFCLLYRKLKATFLLGTGAVAVTTLTLAYAKYDKQFADQLTSYAPFIKNLLDDSRTLKAKDDEIFEFHKKKTNKPTDAAKSINNFNQKSDGEGKTVLTEKKDEQTKIQEPQKLTNTSENQPKITEKDLKNEVLNLQLKVKFTNSAFFLLIYLFNFQAENPNVLEDEFRGQLKRLLYAFNEFYEEKRILYETENKRKQEVEMKNYLIQERASMSEEYEKSMKKLKQMENLLQSNIQMKTHL